MKNIDYSKYENGKANIDSFVDKLKEMPFYAKYESYVKQNKDKNTVKMLQAPSMLFAMFDEEFGAMLMVVSTELLFALADQKLRSEILSQEKRGE